MQPMRKFARRRVGQEFDCFDALSQLVEDDNAVLEQRFAIDCRLRAVAVAIKQTHAEHMFEIGDDFRNDRLGDGEMLGRPGHAALLHDGEQDMKVPQSDAATDAVRPFHVRPRCSITRTTYGIIEN